MWIPPRVQTISFGVMLLLTLSLATSASSQSQTQKQSAWQQLLILVDQDLHKLEANDMATVDGFANTVIANRNETQGHWLEGGEVRLRFIWKLSNPSKRVVLFDSPIDFMSPGQQVHYLYFFDQTGQPLGSSRFSSGWRMDVDEAKLVRRNHLSLLELSAGGAGSFAYSPTLKESYALLDDRAVLVRLEEKSGLTRNSYGCPYPAVGPPVPKRTANEWLNALSSEDNVEVLQALMWIAGRHPDVEELKQEQEDEEFIRKRYPDDPKMETTLERCPGVIEEAKLFSEVIARKDVSTKLNVLRRSDNQWIRDAAEFAAQKLKQELESAPKAP